MFPAIDIAASGLAAQRVRMAAIANNLANVSTTRNEAGELEPYRPRFAVFAADDSGKGPEGAAGVKVSSVEIADVPPRLRYEPHHPDARPDGYVEYPNVNTMVEFTDALEASRAYEANVGVIEISKDLTLQSLRILA